MEDYKKIIQQTFNSVSQGYDNNNLRFFKTSAEQMADMLKLQGEEHILDVASGTGNVAMAVLDKLTRGMVHATDISEKMLEQLKKKASKNNHQNITFELCDMELLNKGPVFDVTTCGFGVFFIADMLNGLQKIKSNLKSEGRILITTFNENFLGSLRQLFYARLENNGIEMPPSPWEYINTPEKTQKLLAKAGYKDISITLGQHGFFLKDEQAWWDVVWNSGMQGAYEMLPKERREPFLKEHFEEISTLKTKDGIWMDVEVIFGMGYN